MRIRGCTLTIELAQSIGNSSLSGGLSVRRLLFIVARYIGAPAIILIGQDLTYGSMDERIVPIVPTTRIELYLEEYDVGFLSLSELSILEVMFDYHGLDTTNGDSVMIIISKAKLSHDMFSNLCNLLKSLERFLKTRL